MGKNYNMEEKDWNINQGFVMVLTNLIVKVNDAAMEGSVDGWFNALIVLYRNVAGHGKMNQEVIVEIDKKIFDVRDRMQKLKNPPNTREGIVRQRLEKEEIKEMLHDINIKLITEMHKAELIFPIIKKNAQFAALEL